ncbi:hypothetical protein [Streptomyces sp. NBC_00299]|uniref:hypothetical protein n=1 Tax=Streptomyces sp. NBC_00299 TaxID=2975705 RepID=UPI002E2D31EF|nr:hypothetical protein [Streptomyces sp. NBC_00299]
MSDDVGFPVLRTGDPACALRLARRLVAVGDTRHAEVLVDIDLPGVEDVLRARSLWPQAWFTWEGGPIVWERGDLVDPTGLIGGVRGADLPSDHGRLSEHLPLRMELWEQPLGSVEDDFVALAAPHVAQLHWWNLDWPEVPELGLHPERKHAEVTVLFNTPTPALEERVDGHTVLVHVRDTSNKESMLRRASWVAEQAGVTVIGGPVRG